MKRAVLPSVLLVLMALIYFMKGGDEVRHLKSGDTILAFGDSITYGYAAKPSESYPSVLQALTGYRVINGGVNGETSDEMLARLPALLEDPSVRLLLLCSGGNDILQQRSRSRLKTNLLRMIGMAKARGIDVVLIGVPSFGAFGLSSLPLYDEVAAEEGVAYMPSLLPEILEERSLKYDYVHPNAAGYRRMAERIRDRLDALGYTTPD